ncbi:MAG: DUF3089 domain-containing protein [Desulfarculus sp.]|nr:DUF3089 domain-containing protein [Desulfarculus sp.]
MRAKATCLVLAMLLGSLLLAGNGQAAYDPIDYSAPNHWLSLPSSINKGVDVFYLYPTAWQKTNASDPSICDIDNASMLYYSKNAYQRQATAFETVANIYAPYYRQVDLTPPPEVRTRLTAGIPTSDATAAFDYYITHLNNGRSFILAGHSQGSDVLVNLLASYMKDHPDVQKRMIAAYVIGYSVTSSYLAANPHLKFAEGADDTGVIISYNTEAPDTVAGTNPVVLPGALAINPITWTRSETPAAASQNLGSIMLNPDGSVVLDKDGNFLVVKDYADARVDLARGVVICSTADENKLAPGNATFGRGVYHSFDIPFYYYNIRANAENRVYKYLKIR